MQNEKLNPGQVKVTATGFLSLFSIVGIMFYGLPFFFDFWVTDFGWNRATVTSGNLAGKVIIGPLFGFVAGWIVDKFGPKRLMIFGIMICGSFCFLVKRNLTLIRRLGRHPEPKAKDLFAI